MNNTYGRIPHWLIKGELKTAKNTSYNPKILEKRTPFLDFILSLLIDL